MGTRGVVNSLHGRSPSAAPTLTGEEKEFLYFGWVSRIRFRGQSQLDRADDPTRLARPEKHAVALSHVLKDRAPILLRLLCAQGRQKAYRGAVGDGILQQMDQMRKYDLFLSGRNAFARGYERITH